VPARHHAAQASPLPGQPVLPHGIGKGRGGGVCMNTGLAAAMPRRMP